LSSRPIQPGIGHSSALPDAVWITGNRHETSDAGH
jgi:hypothetical protein